MALLEEAEAEAAEAEALAAAARARARAARLRREALAEANVEPAEAVEPTEAAEPSDERPEEGADDTTEALDAKADEKAPERTIAAVEPESSRAGRRRRLPWLLAAAKVAAIALICAFAGLSAYMLWQDHEAAQRQQRAASFIAGARQGIVNMTSLDFNRAKEDVQRVIDSSTGQFRDDFQQRAKDFVTVVEQSKVVTQGTVTEAAIESMDSHSASVLVSATSRITNSAGAKDEPRMWRLRVTVTEEGGQYKMSKVDFIT
jgi:Mce-associated membrane protein